MSHAAASDESTNVAVLFRVLVLVFAWNLFGPSSCNRILSVLGWQFYKQELAHGGQTGRPLVTSRLYISTMHTCMGPDQVQLRSLPLRAAVQCFMC
jgi:hypothetical protein